MGTSPTQPTWAFNVLLVLRKQLKWTKILDTPILQNTKLHQNIKSRTYFSWFSPALPWHANEEERATERSYNYNVNPCSQQLEG